MIADDARLYCFGVANEAGFVDVFVSKPDVCGTWRFQSRSATTSISGSDFAARLSCVVFVGQAPLCGGLDLKRISLGAMCVLVRRSSRRHDDAGKGGADTGQPFSG